MWDENDQTNNVDTACNASNAKERQLFSSFAIACHKEFLMMNVYWNEMRSLILILGDDIEGLSGRL